MAYRQSQALTRWLGPRRDVINVLQDAHKLTSQVTGPGRPLDVGRPVAHAYVLHVVAEFQAFVRDLHDLGVLALIEATGASPPVASLLHVAVVEGRAIDRGNATISSIQSDFRRMGLKALNDRLGNVQPRWRPSPGGGPSDSKKFEQLLDLRNSLAHGNANELIELRTGGVHDTVTWTRGNLPALNRTARALDRLVWDHFVKATGETPWE